MLRATELHRLYRISINQSSWIHLYKCKILSRDHWCWRSIKTYPQHCTVLAIPETCESLQGPNKPHKVWDTTFCYGHPPPALHCLKRFNSFNLGPVHKKTPMNICCHALREVAWMPQLLTGGCKIILTEWRVVSVTQFFRIFCKIIS